MDEAERTAPADRRRRAAAFWNFWITRPRQNGGEQAVGPGFRAALPRRASASSDGHPISAAMNTCGRGSTSLFSSPDCHTKKGLEKM
jgi:hypothetical protein